LQDFPAQAAACHLDLDNSFVDFSSDNYGPKTDSIPFNASVNSLTAGGDLVFRFDRALLVNVDLENITHIRFRLAAIGSGSMTFIAQAFRMFPQSGHTYYENYIDTKRKALIRETTATGGLSPGNTEILY
jgi:hypothetical protein